jgi:hypothetical protein
VLGLSEDENDPTIQPSKTKAAAVLNRISLAAQAYVSGPLLADLRQRFANILHTEESWELVADAEDPATLIFRYPRALSRDEYAFYVFPAIRLEFGARGEGNTAP